MQDRFFQKNYNVIPRSIRDTSAYPEQEYMHIDQPNSTPLLLTYDPHFKNKENVRLSVGKIDDQVQEMPEFAAPRKTVGVRRVEKPRFSSDSIQEVMPIIEMKAKNEQKKLPRNPSIQVILNMLTNIKDFILEILGYHPSSPQAQQAISKSMQKAAKNIQKGIDPDGEPNPTVVIKEVESLTQDLVKQQDQKNL